MDQVIANAFIAKIRGAEDIAQIKGEIVLFNSDHHGVLDNEIYRIMIVIADKAQRIAEKETLEFGAKMADRAIETRK